MLKGKTIVLGVTGSIAAYKMANVASMLVKRGCEVHVVMTKNATNFINPIAFESLTNTKCLVETFDRNFQFHVAHVSLTDKADAMLIAPASANIIGKIANGIADDMLSTTVMACNKPVIISPAMNTKMYNNPILQDNLDKLRRFGYEIVEPANGHLACGTSGAGKSYYVKLNILRYRLFGIEQYIIDPEREYNNMCEKLGGTLLKIGTTSKTYINIFDIREESIEEIGKGYLATKIGKLIGFFNLVFGDINEEEKGVLENKIVDCYKEKKINFDDNSLYKKEKEKHMTSRPHDCTAPAMCFHFRKEKKRNPCGEHGE